MDDELESFKRGIDLRQYAAAQGYELDKRDSWRGSAVMRCGGDKIVIKRNTNDHYVYFSVRDDADNGSIIDFIQKRHRCSLGHVRMELRGWVKSATGSLPLLPALEPAGKDRMRVETDYRRMQEIAAHPYLLERGLPESVLNAERFRGRVRIDGRGNAVFPHFDDEGLCGFEIKNRGFTGFASGGTKGLFFSRTWPEDHRLVIAESAIDALSYGALFADESDKTRYASIGGKPGPKQPGLIRAAVMKLPEGSTIIAAMDSDEDGGHLAELVHQAVKDTNRPTLLFTAHRPEGVKDWNDALRATTPPFPIARPSPQAAR